MEITSEEQKKLKKMNWGPYMGPYQTHQHSNYRDTRRRREKERIWENFWRDYSWKFPQHRKGNSQSSSRGTESHTGYTQGETCQDTW